MASVAGLPCSVQGDHPEEGVLANGSMERVGCAAFLDSGLYPTRVPKKLHEPYPSGSGLAGELEGGFTPASFVNYPECGQLYLASQGLGSSSRECGRSGPVSFRPGCILASWTLLTSRDLARNGQVPHKYGLL